MHSSNSNSTLSSSCWKVFLIYARCMIYLSCLTLLYTILKPRKIVSIFYFTQSKKFTNIHLFIYLFSADLLNALEMKYSNSRIMSATITTPIQIITVIPTTTTTTLEKKTSRITTHRQSRKQTGKGYVLY